MPKIVNTDEKKREIAKVALENFLQRGYQKTTIQSIAISSKMGRSTIYQYFDNKEAIFFEVIRCFFLDIEERLDDIKENKDLSKEEKLRELLSFVFELPRNKHSNLLELARVISSLENKGFRIISVINSFEDKLIVELKSLFSNEDNVIFFILSMWKTFAIGRYENSISDDFIRSKIYELSLMVLN
ncbi:MAG: TetR/AcrR family transcriptional regulator [Filifactor alocis]|nr:TetR/AcrR family transcriptional regulator [Filifactor alocis]